MSEELKRMEMVARNIHVPAPRAREDVRTALGLLKRAHEIIEVSAPYDGRLLQWLADYKAANGE